MPELNGLTLPIPSPSAPQDDTDVSSLLELINWFSMVLEANDLPTVHGYVLCKFGSFWTHAIRERLILPLDVPQNRVSYDVLPWMTWLNKNLWFMTMQYATRTAAMLPVWCLLFGWHLIVAELDCAKTALAMVLMAMLMMSSGAELAFSRRNAFVRHYLETGGRLFRLLSGRTLILLIQCVKAMVLGVFLLIGVLQLENTQWLLLLADVPVLALLLTGISHFLAGEVQHEYSGPMARQWATRINATFLWLGAVILMFFSPQENYVHLRWDEVLAYSANQPKVGCDALAFLTRLAAEGEALGLWSAQHLFASLRQPAQVLAAWVIFLLAFGTSFLLAWSYSRALISVLARPWEVRRPGVNGP